MRTAMRAAATALVTATLLLLGLGEVRAQDTPDKGATPAKAKDKSFEEIVAEIEDGLNQVFGVENGKLKVREELKEHLPFSPEALGGMLEQHIAIDKDGRIRIKDPQQLRPYLGMLRNVFSEEGRKRMEALAKDFSEKSPDEKRRILLKAVGEARKAGPEPEAPPEKPDAGAPAKDPQLVRRLEELQEAQQKLVDELRRIEKELEVVRSELGVPEPPRRLPVGGERPTLATLADVVEQARRDAGTFSRGFEKIRQIAEPGDYERLSEVLEKMREAVRSGDIHDSRQLMQRLQACLSPEDFDRGMQIFAEFMESEEGYSMERRIEEILSDIEAFLNSDRGRELEKQVERTLDDMNEFLKSERGKELIENLDKLRKALEGIGAPREAPPAPPAPAEKRAEEPEKRKAARDF